MTRNTSGLARGTEVRSRRAHLKRRVREGSVDVPALLDGVGPEDDELVALAMPLYQLAAAIPGLGDEALLSLSTNGFAAELHPTTRLADLTVRQRRALADALRKETSR